MLDFNDNAQAILSGIERILAEHSSPWLNKKQAACHLCCHPNHLARLEREGRLESYMSLLVDHFNVDTLDELMCKNMVSVGFDGRLSDCDFNYALDLVMRVALHQIECEYPGAGVQHRYDITNECTNKTQRAEHGARGKAVTTVITYADDILYAGTNTRGVTGHDERPLPDVQELRAHHGRGQDGQHVLEHAGGDAQQQELDALRVSPNAATDPETMSRLKQLERLQREPLQLSRKAVAVSARSLQAGDGLSKLRRMIVEAAFDVRAFPTFGQNQPKTYHNILIELKRLHQDKSSVTWTQMQQTLAQKPDIEATAFSVVYARTELWHGH